MKRHLATIAIVIVLCVFGCAYAAEAAEAAPAVTADAFDQIVNGVLGLLPPAAQRVILFVWAVATAVGALASLAAVVLKAVRGDDSRSAWWANVIGYWASKLGTSLRLRASIAKAPEKPGV